MAISWQWIDRSAGNLSLWRTLTLWTTTAVKILNA